MSLYAWVVAVVLAAGGGFVGGAKWVHAQWGAERLERAEVAAEAQRQVRMVETKRAAGAQEALNGYAKKTRAAVASAAATATELERVRSALAAGGALPADPAAAAGADDASRARYVVGQCAGALQKMAAAADTCEARLTGLQAWAKAVSEAP